LILSQWTFKNRSGVNELVGFKNSMRKTVLDLLKPVY